MSAALFVGACLAAACVLVVALPYLREPGPADDTLDEPDSLERRRLGMLEARDRALSSLKELELDHRTGKVTDEDYRAAVGSLRREAADALRALALQEVAVPNGGGVEAGRTGQRGVMEPLDPTPPAEIPEAYPPPGELDPPEQPVIPEPYPPPGELDPPQQPVAPEPGPQI